MIASGAGVAALLICPNGEMSSELNPLLNHHLPGAKIHLLKEYPSSEELSVAIQEHVPRLCFLDAVSDEKLADATLGDLQILDGSIQTVVLLSANAPDLILRCLRQGAAEFMIQPFSSEDLKPVLSRLAQLTPANFSYGKGGRIIALAPAKGSCGSSTIAANLASHHKKLGANRVLLADMDALTGILSFLLKVKSNYSVMDAVTRSSSLDRDLWNGMVAHVNGIDVLLAPENPMDTLQESTDPTPILEFARQLYDLVILDCPVLLSEWGLPLANACDELYLVTTNELPALQATQRVLSYLDNNRVERSKLRLVVNRYSRDVGLSEDAIATALHTDVHQVIASDYTAVQRALVEGKPIPLNSAFGKGLSALAERISGANSNGSSPKKKTKNSGLGKMISSFFSKK